MEQDNLTYLVPFRKLTHKPHISVRHFFWVPSGSMLVRWVVRARFNTGLEEARSFATKKEAFELAKRWFEGKDL